MTQDRQMAFQFPVRIYWEDTDAGGIVFYANYLKFFERARTEWLRSLGLGQQQLRDTLGGMFVVAETSMRYLRPARLDDELLVSAQVHAMGRSHMTLQQQAVLLLPNAPPAPVCEGTVRIVWVDAASFRPARIPDSIFDLF